MSRWTGVPNQLAGQCMNWWHLENKSSRCRFNILSLSLTQPDSLCSHSGSNVKAPLMFSCTCCDSSCTFGSLVYATCQLFGSASVNNLPGSSLSTGPCLISLRLPLPSEKHVFTFFMLFYIHIKIPWSLPHCLAFCIFKSASSRG